MTQSASFSVVQLGEWPASERTAADTKCQQPVYLSWWIPNSHGEPASWPIRSSSSFSAS